MVKASAYEQVTRQIVTEIQSNVTEIKSKIDNLDGKMIELYNHQSSRLLVWGTWLVTSLSSLLSALIVYIVTK